jgi:holo-[acyl-carrier protein] synthase
MMLNLPPYHIIYGIGTDICKISRIEKLYHQYPDAFLKRVYSPAEQNKFHALAEKLKIPFLAKRFAAKESCVKALKTGFGHAALMRDVEILNNDAGTPQVTLYNKALCTAHTLAKGQKFDFFMSLSDDSDFAQAFCIFALATHHEQE